MRYAPFDAATFTDMLPRYAALCLFAGAMFVYDMVVYAAMRAQRARYAR